MAQHQQMSAVLTARIMDFLDNDPRLDGRRWMNSYGANQWLRHMPEDEVNQTIADLEHLLVELKKEKIRLYGRAGWQPWEQPGMPRTRPPSPQAPGRTMTTMEELANQARALGFYGRMYQQ